MDVSAIRKAHVQLRLIRQTMLEARAAIEEDENEAKQVQ